MRRHPFPSLILPPDLDPESVECLDNRGTPLMVTTRAAAPGTGLIWRLVGSSLLVGANRPERRRLVLRRAHPASSLSAGLWELPVLGSLRAGEAPLDAARRLFAVFGVETPRLYLAALFPPEDLTEVFPPSQFGRVSLTLFRAGPVQPYLSAGQDMLLDADELSGVIHMLPDSVSPVVRFLFARGEL